MKRTKITAVILAAVMTFTGAPALLESLTAVSYAASVQESARPEAKIAAPSGIKAASKTTSSITLKWNKVSGASAYRVYIYNSSKKKYVKYKDVSVATCKVTGLSAGKSYKFKVASLKKSGKKYSLQSTSGVFTAKTSSSKLLSAPKNIKGEERVASIYLTWSSVKGASGYKVSVYNPSTKKYEAYKTVLETKCSVEGLAENTKYKIKITTLISKGGQFVDQKSSSAKKFTTKQKTSNGQTSSPNTLLSSAEFALPEPGASLVFVLNNCGISNYTKDVTGTGADRITVYTGETRLGGQVAELVLTFDRFNTISKVNITTAITPSTFRAIFEVLEKKFSKYKYKKYKSKTGDDGYTWDMDGILVTFEYNSRLKCAVFNADYYG